MRANIIYGLGQGARRRLVSVLSSPSEHTNVETTLRTVAP